MVKPASTIDVVTNDGTSTSAREPLLLALMIAWAAAEPERVGEVALFDPDGGARIWGRGSPEGSGGERVAFLRQRPGVVDRMPPLASPGLSREQLRIRVDRGRLRVEQLGKCVLEAGGKQVDRCIIAPGESFLLKGQLLLYCTLRPRKLEPLRAPPIAKTVAFGLPDAFGIVGESPAAWRLRDQLGWLAKANEHTLLLGESGSGKELCARALHALSGRSKGPFVARNAATIPAGVIDAELFGNVKNYPNPGMAERPGLIGAAHEGTLFLDEIGELPQNLQANLLRVLDEGGEYHNLGGTSTKRSDFRLLGATNRSPEALKHDLAARLVLRLDVPGLDERKEDIPLLVRVLLRRALTKSPEAVKRFFTAKVDGSPEPNVRVNLIDALMRHSYTTNIRELDALLWRAMSTSTGNVIEWAGAAPGLEATLPEQRANERSGENEPPDVSEPAKEPSEAEVRASLAEYNGNIVRAAKALGLSSRYVLYRLMRKHGIAGE